jgi:outer membrane protein, heavy metal efflux system
MTRKSENNRMESSSTAGRFTPGPAWLAFFIAAGLAGSAGCYHAQPLTSEGVERLLAPPALEVMRVQARTLAHPLIRSVAFDDRDGLSPDEAAILAVLANPALRAVRDGRGLSAAQVLQAGILPNPSLSAEGEFPLHVPGEVNGYTLDALWDVTSLITLAAKVDAAKSAAASVDLDIAWQEWQVAQAARLSAYRCLALEAQLAAAEKIATRQRENLKTINEAVEKNFKTQIEQAAAQAAVQEAEAAVLDIRADLRKEQLALNKSLGLAPETRIVLQENVPLPSHLTLPPAADLLKGMEERRLDLVALRRGYDSQEAAVRAAVLAQFPKVEIGIHHTRDSGSFFTLGPLVTLDLPIFDRNQGNIALEQATRQKLYDEYANRVFEARSDIATALAEVDSCLGKLAHAEAALPILQEGARSFKEAFEAGHLDVLAYYGALNDLDKKTLDVLKLKQELMDLRVALEMASGRYLETEPAAVPVPAAATKEADR